MERKLKSEAKKTKKQFEEIASIISRKRFLKTYTLNQTMDKISDAINEYAASHQGISCMTSKSDSSLQISRSITTGEHSTGYALAIPYQNTCFNATVYKNAIAEKIRSVTEDMIYAGFVSGLHPEDSKDTKKANAKKTAAATAAYEKLVKDLKTELASDRRKRTIAQKKLTELTTEYNKKKIDIYTKDKEYQEALNALNKKQASVDAKIKELNNLINQAKNNIVGLDAELFSFSQEQKKKIQSKNASIKNLKTNFENAEKAKSAAQEDLRKAKFKCENALLFKSKKKMLCDQAEALYNKATEKAADLKATLEKAVSDLHTLESKLSLKQCEIEKRKEAHQNNINKYSAQRNSINSDTQNEISKIKTAKQDNLKVIPELENTIKTIEDKISNLTKDIERNEKSLNNPASLKRKATTISNRAKAKPASSSRSKGKKAQSAAGSNAPNYIGPPNRRVIFIDNDVLFPMYNNEDGAETKFVKLFWG